MKKAAWEYLGKNRWEHPGKGPTTEAGVVCPGTSKAASVTGVECLRTAKK